jgi:hypothetical protein
MNIIFLYYYYIKMSSVFDFAESIDLNSNFNYSCNDSTVCGVVPVRVRNGNQSNSHFVENDGEVYDSSQIEIFICKFSGNPVGSCPCCMGSD